jgi:membrane protein
VAHRGLVLLALDDRRPLLRDPERPLRGFTWVSPGAGVADRRGRSSPRRCSPFYVGNFGSYNKTYGTLAGVIVFLIWFWLINLALLFGIELDAEIERTKELKEGVPRAEKEIQLDAREEPKPQQTT